MFKARDIRQLNAIFRNLATAPHCGRGEFSGGCGTRAAQARAALMRGGYRVGSCVLHGTLTPATGKGAPLCGYKFVLDKGEQPYSVWHRVRWRRHIVGVAVLEDKNGDDMPVVLDTVVCDGPMRLAEYLKLYGPDVSHRLVTSPDAHRVAATRMAAPHGFMLRSLGQFDCIDDDDGLLGATPSGHHFALRRGFRTLGGMLGYGNLRVLPLAHMPDRAVDKALLPVMAYRAPQ